MKTAKSILVFSILAISLMSFTVIPNNWDFLGKRTVDFGVDRDVIHVTAKEGTFKRIKLEVKKAPVHFREVVVHYRNGQKESIALRDNIPAGGQTRAIDLSGKNRIIKKVVFYYNSKAKVRRKGLVKLYGWN